MTTWQEVWANRRPDPSLTTTLQRLMALDGFDGGFGSVTESEWEGFVTRAADTAGIHEGASVFEVGCGAGAFLYPLACIGCEVAGLDGSQALIEDARTSIPAGTFVVGDAASLDIDAPFDFVVSCSVFMYFPTLEYAREVVRRMALKASVGVAILDVPDKALESDALAARRAELGDAEYTARYATLQHLYYTRDWLAGALKIAGMRRVQIEDQAIAGTLNAGFRFNAFAWR